MRFGIFAILFFNWFLANGQAAELPTKAAVKSITVYQDPG